MNEYYYERKWVDAGNKIYEIMGWWFGKNNEYANQR
jgi:hypothetical protein